MESRFEIRECGEDGTVPTQGTLGLMAEGGSEVEIKKLYLSLKAKGHNVKILKVVRTEIQCFL
jgi:hypothetical protein